MCSNCNHMHDAPSATYQKPANDRRLYALALRGLRGRYRGVFNCRVRHADALPPNARRFRRLVHGTVCFSKNTSMERCFSNTSMERCFLKKCPWNGVVFVHGTVFFSKNASVMLTLYRQTLGYFNVSSMERCVFLKCMFLRPSVLPPQS